MFVDGVEAATQIFNFANAKLALKEITKFCQTDRIKMVSYPLYTGKREIQCKHNA